MVQTREWEWIAHDLEGKTSGGLTAVAVVGVLINNFWFRRQGQEDLIHSRYFNPVAAQPIIVSYFQPSGLTAIRPLLNSRLVA